MRAQESLDRVLADLAWVRDEDLASICETPAARALLAEIVADERSPEVALRRGRRRLRRPLVTAFAAAVALLVTGTIAGGSNDHRVSAADALLDPVAVEQSLRDAGYQAAVLVVPTDRPGTWWHLHFVPGVDVDLEDWARLKAQVGVGVAGLPEDVLDAGRGVYHSEVLTLPDELPGPFTLVVGRAPRPGEALAPMENELGPSGAFYCWHLERLPPEEAASTLRELGYEVVWRPPDVGNRSSASIGPPPRGMALVSAWLSSPSEVHVDLAPVASAETTRAEQGTPTRNAPAPNWAPAC